MKNVCPNCKSTNLTIERRLDGITKCNECSYTGPHKDFDSSTWPIVIGRQNDSQQEDYQKIIQEKDEKYQQAVKDIKILSAYTSDALEYEYMRDSFIEKVKEICNRHGISEE
jgi:hypothetical protein